jgi:hypothetical protein
LRFCWLQFAGAKPDPGTLEYRERSTDGREALLAFFGNWGAAAETALMFTYALYLGLAWFIFFSKMRSKGLDGGKIVNVSMWLVEVGLMFWFAVAAAVAAHLKPF